MNFLIASTFTDSLARLTGDEQKAVKTTAFDLQLNPANPGFSFHKLDAARDKHFWSVRVNADIRIIVHKTDASLLLCYVGHHDKAYAWALLRKLETHPKTGAAQLVEIRETVQDIFRPVYLDAAKPVKAQIPLFIKVQDDELLGFGVPLEWLDAVRQATDATLLELTDRLPGEAAEALLELATGGKPKVKAPVITADPFAHPDAQRRFRVMNNIEELEQALEFPWDKWTVFLHPEQRQWVERTYSGPARVAGSAGTGKTIVALHRAVHLAKQNPDSRVLLTTFSDTLANALHGKLRRLIGHEPRLADRLDVLSMNEVGTRLFKTIDAKTKIVSREALLQLLAEQSALAGGRRFSPVFVQGEWADVIDAWQIDSWEAYRDFKRLGRKTRLPELQRSELWQIFDGVRQTLQARALTTQAGVFARLSESLASRKQQPYDFTVVDESQDISPAQLRFLAAMADNRPEALFFAGDLGQRIFQQPFSWNAVGVDIRGRSRTLHVNYRTSHQIRGCADRLLGSTVADVDGNAEERKGTVSVFNGAAPTVQKHPSEFAETHAVAAWLKQRISEGILPQEIGVFVRSAAEIPRAVAAVAAAGLPSQLLDERMNAAGADATISPMHLAKGLEFRAVAVMACDDEVLPLMARIESVGDEGDLEEIYNSERQLLYVACTRARDHLLVTGVNPASEFLADLGVSAGNS